MYLVLEEDERCENRPAEHQFGEVRLLHLELPAIQAMQETRRETVGNGSFYEPLLP